VKLGQLYSEMIYVKGLIHCDPHPGNILIRKNPQNGRQEVILLDHGLYLVSVSFFFLILARINCVHDFKFTKITPHKIFQNG